MIETDNEKLIFRVGNVPLIFYIGVEDAKNVYECGRLIQKHGGIVVFESSKCSIILSEPESNVYYEEIYDIKYIKDCIASGKLLDITDYRIDRKPNLEISLKKLFVDKEQKPLVFYIEGVQKKKLFETGKLIQMYGGLVVFEVTEGVIVLSSPHNDPNYFKEIYNIKYIKDCINLDKLLDISNYRITQNAIPGKESIQLPTQQDPNSIQSNPVEKVISVNSIPKMTQSAIVMEEPIQKPRSIKPQPIEEEINVNSAPNSEEKMQTEEIPRKSENVVAQIPQLEVISPMSPAQPMGNNYFVISRPYVPVNDQPISYILTSNQMQNQILPIQCNLPFNYLISNFGQII